MSLLYPLARKFLFSMDAEKSHDLTLNWLSKIQRSPFEFLIRQPKVHDPITLFGIEFPNRIGLAAGLDKNGACVDAFAALGFGHIEVGTVTPRSQPGNPKPRLFRIKEKRGIVNRFGFNNLGVDHLIENVKAAKFDGVLGINIGKNFDTPVENANDDYLICMDKVYAYASYITVNISSPNTANLRSLQFGEALESLLKAIKTKQTELAKVHDKYVPVLVKIAPDLSDDEINQLATSFKKYEIDGVIATNTSFDRSEVEGLKHADETGGLSGAPILKSTTQVLDKFCQAVDGAFPVIGVGGVDNGEAATDKIKAGASLVQIYSGFIYRGPNLVTEAANAIKLSK